MQHRYQENILITQETKIIQSIILGLLCLQCTKYVHIVSKSKKFSNILTSNCLSNMS